MMDPQTFHRLMVETERVRDRAQAFVDELNSYHARWIDLDTEMGELTAEQKARVESVLAEIAKLGEAT